MTKESPNFKNIEMDVGLVFGNVKVDWHPKSMNRLIRFFRFIKLERDVVEQETAKYLKDI